MRVRVITDTAASVNIEYCIPGVCSYVSLCKCRLIMLFFIVFLREESSLSLPSSSGFDSSQFSSTGYGSSYGSSSSGYGSSQSSYGSSSSGYGSSRSSSGYGSSRSSSGYSSSPAPRKYID